MMETDCGESRESCGRKRYPTPYDICGSAVGTTRPRSDSMSDRILRMSDPLITTPSNLSWWRSAQGYYLYTKDFRPVNLLSAFGQFAGRVHIALFLRRVKSRP